MWPKITLNYSPNFSLSKRSKKKINFIIIHYTGMKKESAALRRLCNIKSQVSSHYFIKKNGEILRLVPDLHQAWHAGKSSWKKEYSLNKNSIGIEIQNQGHEFKYEKFSSKQINSLKKLLRVLIKKFKIKKNNIIGHSDIAPSRKKDPGEKFPWENLAKANLAQWHSLDKKKLISKRLKNLNMNEDKEFLKNLYMIGYTKIKKASQNQNKNFLTKAFQRRFRQSLVNGKSDKECFLITKSLLNDNKNT